MTNAALEARGEMRAASGLVPRKAQVKKKATTPDTGQGSSGAATARAVGGGGVRPRVKTSGG